MMELMTDPRAVPRVTSVGADLDELFRREGDGLYRTLVAFTGGRVAIAEDATAEAFARAIAHEGQLRDPIAWIYRVAFRAATDEIRHERRSAASNIETDAVVAPPELGGVIEALRKLSPNQRAAVVLRHVLDLDVDDVAARMGIASPTVRVHLHRARRRLRALLGDEEADR